MANNSGELTRYEGNQGVQGKAITGPSVFNLQSSNNSVTSRFNLVDKQSGSYIRTSVKENNSSGDVFKERSTGRIGFKDEEKVITTVKVGDKSGFSEYQVEERFRTVNYDGHGKNNSSAWKTGEVSKENIPTEYNGKNECEYDEGTHEVEYDASVDGGYHDAWGDCGGFDDGNYGCDHGDYGYDHDDDDYY